MKTNLATTLCLFPLLALAATGAEPCCPPEVPAELPVQEHAAESLYQLETTFTDDSGRRFALGELRGRPVVLAMFFTSCHYACPLIVADMTRIRDALPPERRDEVSLVLVSLDVANDTPEALRRYREERMLDGQWTLLRGEEDAVRELAALLGVIYKQEIDGQFAHSNLITILDARGEVVHRRTGLRGGLAEAAAGLLVAARDANAKP